MYNKSSDETLIKLDLIDFNTTSMYIKLLSSHSQDYSSFSMLYFHKNQEIHSVRNFMCALKQYKPERIINFSYQVFWVEGNHDVIVVWSDLETTLFSNRSISD